MTGVCSPSMPVWVVEGGGARAFSTLNEGPGRTLWFGVGDDEAVERLRFFRDELGPTLARLLERRGPVDVFALAAQGLNMGDELHMRSQATGNLLIRDLAPAFAAVGGEPSARFVAGNHHFFLNLTMAACKCAWLAAGAVEGSSVVSVMARNGTDMGLQLAGLPGRWFTAPAAPVQDTLLREGHTADDAALDIGDSAVIECTGLGGMALAAAPAVAAFFGGDAAAAAARTELMAQICVGPLRRASRSPRATTRAPAWGSTRGWSPSSASRRRSPPACCTRARARARSAPASPTSRSSRSGTRCSRSTSAAGRIEGVIEVGPNFIARPYRGVSVQDAPGLDEATLREWLIGRRVYRRTEFVVAACGGEHAVVQVEHPVGDDILAPVSDLRVLARPDRGGVRRAIRRSTPATPRRWRALARARVTVVQGRFEHVNFIVEPAPLRVRVLEVVPPEPPKLLEMARSVLDYDEDLPPVELDFAPIDLRELARRGPTMYPCRCSGPRGRVPRRRPGRARRLDARGLRALAPDPRRAVRRRAGRASRLLPARAGGRRTGRR